MKRKTVLFLFASYLLVLIIPLLIGMRLYESAIRITEEEAIRYNDALLTQVQRSVDVQLEDISDIVYQIVVNDRITGLVKAQQPLETTHREQIIALLKDLKAVKINNSMYEGMYLYFFNSDVLLTQTGMYDSRLFFVDSMKLSEDAYERVKTLLRERYYNYKTYQMIEPLRRPSGGEFIYCIQSLPIPNERRNDAVVMIAIRTDGIRALIETIQDANKGVVYVIDAQDQIISTTAPESYDGYVLTSALRQSANFTDEWRGTRRMITVRASAYAPIHYVSIIPESEYMEQAEKIRTAATRWLMLGMLAGCITALISAYRHYQPIKRLEEQARMATHENQRLTSLWERQKASVVDALLLRLIKGAEEDREMILASLSAYGIHMDAPWSAVILINRLTRREVEAIFLERQAPQARFYITQELHTVVLLCFFSAPAGYETLRTRLPAVLPQEGKARLGMSALHGRAEGLPAAYQEAGDALHYALLTNAPFITEADLAGHTTHYDYPLEVSMQVVRAVKIGNIHTVRQLLDGVARGNLDQRELPLEMLQYLTIDMMGTLMKALDAVDIPYTSIAPEHPMHMLAACESFDAFYKRLLTLYHALCERVRARQRSQNHLL
ncbi:MAG TPA: hypothetical protein PKE04_12420, partial [Clostridia bacterium]|nr:hypothetical protein [Clostridia bacterium]